MAEKPTAIPLNLNRIKGSNKWKAMQDYERGWYMSLLIEAADSDRTGYLPRDKELYRLAGARSRSFFDEHFDSGLVGACFKRQEFDGRTWIYNEPLLKSLKKEEKARKQKAELIDVGVVSDSTKDLTEQGFLSAWKSYRKKWAKAHARKQYERAIKRLCAGEQGERMSPEEAITWLNERIYGYSLAMQNVEIQHVCNFGTFVGAEKKRYEDDPGQWVRSEEKQEPGRGGGNCEKHPNSGLTVTGGCFGCYFGDTA